MPEIKRHPWTLDEEVWLMEMWRDRSLSLAEISRRLGRHPSSVTWKALALRLPKDRSQYIKAPPEPEKPLPDSGYGYRGELKSSF